MHFSNAHDDGDDEKKISLTRADRPPPSLEKLDFNQEQKKKEALKPP